MLGEASSAATVWANVEPLLPETVVKKIRAVKWNESLDAMAIRLLAKGGELSEALGLAFPTLSPLEKMVLAAKLNGLLNSKLQTTQQENDPSIAAAVLALNTFIPPASDSLQKNHDASTTAKSNTEDSIPQHCPSPNPTKEPQPNSIEIVHVDEFEIYTATSAMQKLRKNTSPQYPPRRGRPRRGITMTRAEMRAAAAKLAQQMSTTEGSVVSSGTSPGQSTTESDTELKMMSHHDGTEHENNDDDISQDEDIENALPEPPVVIVQPDSGKALRRSARSIKFPSKLSHDNFDTPLPPGSRHQTQESERYDCQDIEVKNEVDEEESLEGSLPENKQETVRHKGIKSSNPYKRELVAGQRKHPGNRPLFPLELQAMFKDERCRDVVEFDPITGLIRVFDVNRFEAEVMPRHFNTVSHKAFQRQMSYYNFYCCDEHGHSSQKNMNPLILCYKHRDIDLRTPDDFVKVARVNVQPRVRPSKGRKRKGLDGAPSDKVTQKAAKNATRSTAGILSAIINNSAKATSSHNNLSSAHPSTSLISSSLPPPSSFFIREDDNVLSSSSTSSHSDDRHISSNGIDDFQDDSAHQLILQLRNHPSKIL